LTAAGGIGKRDANAAVANTVSQGPLVEVCIGLQPIVTAPGR
jgi:hypothetical protein